MKTGRFVFKSPESPSESNQEASCHRNSQDPETRLNSRYQASFFFCQRFGNRAGRKSKLFTFYNEDCLDLKTNRPVFIPLNFWSFLSQLPTTYNNIIEHQNINIFAESSGPFPFVVHVNKKTKVLISSDLNL